MTSPKHCFHDSADRIGCGAKNASTETVASTAAPLSNPDRSRSFIDCANVPALDHLSRADFLDAPSKTLILIPSRSSALVRSRAAR